ncbi:MAG: DsrE family protein [Bacteroidota bacterium]|jgi:intracellular sulfur oxidation DsrE/DsrF family protein|nr:DsrE family protein [Bacteroidota bacterium]
MKKYVFILCFIISLLHPLFSQTNGVKTDANKRLNDSIAGARKDSIKFAKLMSIAYYPLIKAGPFSGVLPVEGVDEMPDPNKEYKLLFEFTLVEKDTSHEKLNPGLVEIARILNLHAASGIPISHIHPVIVVHGGSALHSIENNEAYISKYKKDNPNIKLIQDLMQNGAKFIACGQAMHFWDLNKADLYPGVKVSLTAQTVLSNYSEQGYVWYKINEE